MKLITEEKLSPIEIQNVNKKNQVIENLQDFYFLVMQI